MEKIAFFGASGTMGRAALSVLLAERKALTLSLLLLPADWKKREIRTLAKRFGLKLRAPRISQDEFATTEVPGLRIVWGYAQNKNAVRATIAGSDWVLNTMALISPAADTQPLLAREVNDDAVQTIIDAICDEPDGAKRIGYVHTGSVAQTGNRPPGFHLGRIGDPMNPSVFDNYAVTKIDGERRVMESPLKKWVSLRMSFIMPTDQGELLRLFGPIVFHMPPDTRIESITDRDAGFALVQCMNQESDSSFWRRAYNIGGGPGMRSVAIEYLDDVFSQLGLDWMRCTARNWYAVQNFHLQFYADSAVANEYLNFWRDDLKSFRESLAASMKWYVKVFTWLNKNFSPFRDLSHSITHRLLKRLAEKHPNSPRYWYLHGNQERLQAFFGNKTVYENIAGWHDPPVNTDHDLPATLFQHGLTPGRSHYLAEEVKAAANFRGGHCEVPSQSVSTFTPITWTCAFGHTFVLKVNTVFHGGHWCPECTRAWNGNLRAKIDQFFGQAWHAATGKVEHGYSEGGNTHDLSQEFFPTA